MIHTSASLLLWASFCLYDVVTLPLLTHSASSCNEPCNIVNDCGGMLICFNGNCNDDVLVNAQMCPKGPLPSPKDDSCRAFGHLNCSGQLYPQYNCSPPVTSSTQAVLLVNDFSEGGDGGAPSECDDKYHDNSEPVAALSTGWYDGGSRCGKMIRIVAQNGTRSVTAKVVDECDSVNVCDAESGGTAPCANNNINGNTPVWDALGLDENLGEVAVTWSMA